MNYNESLNSNSNYPAMSKSEWDNAPWNEEILPDKEIEVTVSVTLSKTVKINVDDYTVEEDGSIDYSSCDLNKAVMEQITLPKDAYNKLFNVVCNSESTEAIRALCDLNGWSLDDFEVIKE